MTDGDRQLLRYLLEDAAAAEQAVGVTWLLPGGQEWHDTGVPRWLPDESGGMPDELHIIDPATDALLCTISLAMIVRVWVPRKTGETLWP